MSTRLATIPDETLERAAAALRVLAHPARLRLVELLLAGDHTVGELAEHAGLAPAACSQHLNQMAAHGLLEKERDGRAVRYRVIDESALRVIDCIRKHGGKSRN